MSFIDYILAFWGEEETLPPKDLDMCFKMYSNFRSFKMLYVWFEGFKKKLFFLAIYGFGFSIFY